MARKLYCASPADFVVDIQTGIPIPNYSLKVWTSRTGGTEVTDLLDIEGNVFPDGLKSDSVGLIRFQGPDGEGDVLWLETGYSDRLAVSPVAGVTDAASLEPIFVNVKDHGAVGNGSTDDTAAIQTAIAALPATGGTLYFPTGRYVVTAGDSVTHPGSQAAKVALTLPSYVTVAGDGPEASVLVLSSSNSADYGDILYGKDKTGIIVQNIGFDGNNARTLPVESVAIQLDACTDTRLFNVCIEGTNSKGAYLYQCDSSFVNTLLSHDGGVSLVIDNSQWVSINGVTVSDGITSGVEIHDSTDITAARIIVSDCAGTGVVIDEDSTRITLTNTLSNGCTANGVSIVDSSAVMFSGLITVNNGANGLYTDNSQNIVVTGLHSVDNTAAGICLDDAGDVVSVYGEYLADNGSATDVTSGALLWRGVQYSGTPNDGDTVRYDSGTDSWILVTSSIVSDNVVYWDEDTETWPSRPSVPSGAYVEWRSVLDPLATPPPDALPGDSWKRAPGSSAS